MLQSLNPVIQSLRAIQETSFVIYLPVQFRVHALGKNRMSLVAFLPLERQNGRSICLSISRQMIKKLVLSIISPPLRVHRTSSICRYVLYYTISILRNAAVYTRTCFLLDPSMLHHLLASGLDSGLGSEVFQLAADA